jgi:SAM-dependent methyltransferase
MAHVSGYDAFAAVYDAWSGHMTEDVGFYVSLAEEANGPVVELAVGNGRVAVPIAQRTGRRVIGIDGSKAMLAGAAERAARAAVTLDLRRGDMRDFSLDEPTDLVICPFRSLLHLPSRDDRLRVFRRVAAALLPGGRFAWNAFVFDPAVAAELHGKWREQNGIRHRVDYDYDAKRIDLTLDGGATVPLWWVDVEEWDGLIDECGLELEARYGWFDRSPFDESSHEAVYVTRKPE